MEVMTPPRRRHFEVQVSSTEGEKQPEPRLPWRKPRRRVLIGPDHDLMLAIRKWSLAVAAGTLLFLACDTATFINPDGSMIVCNTCCHANGRCTTTCYTVPAPYWAPRP